MEILLNCFIIAITIGTIALSALTGAEVGKIIQEIRIKKQINQKLYERFEKNKPFASEELIREADKLMHDDNESDNARDFAKRVYIIGRTAQAHQEDKNDR